MSKTKMTMTLDKAKPEDSVVIKKIDGGFKVNSRLSNMGLVEGEQLTVKRKSSLGGPVIIAYKNAEYVIGKGLAKKVHVSLIT